MTAYQPLNQISILMVMMYCISLMVCWGTVPAAASSISTSRTTPKQKDWLVSELVIPCVLTCIEDERPFVLATTAFAFLVCNFSSRNSRISCLLYYGTLFVLLSLLCTSDQTKYETIVPCLPHFSPIPLMNPTFPWYTPRPVIDSAFIRSSMDKTKQNEW